MIFFLFLIQTVIQQEIQVSKVDSSIRDSKYCGKTKFDPTNPNQDYKRYIFQLTQENTLYYSEDDGETFINIKQRLVNEAKKIEQQQTEYDGQILKIIEVYLLGLLDISFYSNDCGQTFTAFKHHIGMTNLLPNPNGQDLLGLSLLNCPQNMPNCTPVYDLYHSPNNGKNWRLHQQWVIQAEWDCAQDETVVFVSNLFDKNKKKRILMTHYINCNWDIINYCDINVSYSDDKSTKLMLQDAIQYHRTNHYLFALTQRDKSIQLNIASLYFNQHFYHFKPIKVINNELKQNSFTILEARHGVVVLNIDHQENLNKSGNTYVSDYSGTQYFLSLENNAKSQDGLTDFIVIQSLEGVYIANQIIDSQKQTVISHNQGSTWSKIQSKQCQDCYIHLFGFVDSIGTNIHSDEKSKGIIMGLGNEGKYLDQNQINTYISIDGGYTFEEIRKGSHLFEIGEHGGMIVIAKDDQLINEIEYSWDFGLTWNQIKISDTPVKVNSISIDKNKLTQTFLINCEQGKSGIIIRVDFNTINERVCKGHSQPGDKHSDYEIWQPNQNQCIFGKKLYVIRRKRNAKCWNDKHEDSIYNKHSCPCTEDDWECDYGFQRDQNQKCQPIDSKFRIHKSPPKNCHHSYNIKTGYRKIPGNECQGGLDKSTLKLPCDKSKLIKEIKQQIKPIMENNLRKDIQQESNQKFEEFKKQMQPQIEYPKQQNELENYLQEQEKQKNKNYLFTKKQEKQQQDQNGISYYIFLFILILAIILYFSKNFIYKLFNRNNSNNYTYQGLEAFN